MPTTGALSDYAENALLDHVLGKTAFAKPAVYLALFTADPGEASGGTEVSGGAYARQRLDPDTAAASAGSAASNADKTFPVATADWGTVTHVALFDALSGGNRLWHGALTTSKVIATGDQFKFNSGDLTFALD